MKRLIVKPLIGTLIVTMFLVACSDEMLIEKPRSTFTPVFFQTEIGVQGGLTSLYAHLRYIYGQAYYFNSCLTGTDEATWGQSADGNFLQFDYTGRAALTTDNWPSSIPWTESFPAINTASGIIENAVRVGIADELIAEAHFFRAFSYFLLVQTYGGVPLDMGAGILQFNTAPSRTSVRNTVPEVYTLAIIPDLIKAVEDLPETPRLTGTVTKTGARLFLAKAYLTYGWWLENPNNIPTYPDAPRTDPDGRDPQWYYQQAYDVAMEGINNPGVYELQPTYYDVNWAPNDRNSEIMLYADRTEQDEYFNGSSLTYGSGAAPDNFAVWMLYWNYPLIRSSASNTSWEPFESVLREASQDKGRPWSRMTPPIEIFLNTFADKTNDSRYDGTFTTVFRSNWDKGENPNAAVYNVGFEQVQVGDPILTFLEEDVDGIDYNHPIYNSGVGAGVLPGRSDFVIAPSAISRITYPALWKLGTYRTDNQGGLGEPNAGLTRPFNIAKFSELYFIAAEAAVKGAAPQAGASARDLINVIRARAGVWRWSNRDNQEMVVDNSAAMIAATPADIDIDYILAERSREYYGEGYRWYDLVRTQKWTEYATTYSICGPAYTDRTPEIHTREIEPFHYLRPIPQSQIDGMEVTAEEKAAYQNPGY